MNLAEHLRREAATLSKMAYNTKALDADFSRDVGLAAAVLNNLAGVFNVHGLPGVMGYLACLNYSHPVTEGKRNLVLETVNDLLKGKVR